jgi:hypothetical protein
LTDEDFHLLIGLALVNAYGDGQDEVKLTNHSPTLVVKVAKNDLDTLVLLAQHILGWHLNVIERHVGSAGCGRVRGLDLLCLDTLAALDEEHTQALLGSGAGDKVI